MMEEALFNEELMTEKASLPRLSMAVPVIPPSELQLGRPLGKGSYGEVYYSQWQGTDTAVKQLYLSNLPVDLAEEFQQEAVIMANCQHPNIVRLYGICTQPGHYSLVMEYLLKGSLYDILHNTHEKLPWNPLRWQIAIDFEKGLAYLHSKEILHRDLKSLNVLLDGQYHAKIGDFGLSKVKISSQSTASKTQTGAGTTRWRAPELFKRGSKPDKATDVYSSGMVLWEIASRQLPYADAADDRIAMKWIEEGEKENLPSDCPPAYGEIIVSCWQAPALRPTAPKVVSALQSICPKLEVFAAEKFSFTGDKSWHFDPDTPGLDEGGQKTYVLLKASDKEAQKVMGFFYEHAAPSRYNVVSMEVIYNVNMHRKFVLYMDELQNREHNPAFAPRWRTDEPDDADQKALRQKTYTLFEQRAKPYTDPAYPAVKLLPLWHGTRSEILESLFTTGYANLATTDSGYFGKGLYGAWEAEYAQRVYGKGALILNWAAVFSPFPFIHADMNRLRMAEGKANYSNYDAHFVPVYPASKNPKETVYFACKPGQTPVYTEVVVFQSAGLLPRYLVRVEKNDIPKLLTVSSQSSSVGEEQKAIEPDSPTILFRQGYECLHSDPQKAVECFEQAALEGYLPAHAMLGFLHYTGKLADIVRDVNKSQLYYDHLKNNMNSLHTEAKKGSRDHQTALGFCYTYGIGMEKDFKLAAHWYQLAADQGDAKAQCNLALMYEEGKGVKKNQKKAIYCYELAAQKGDRTAMFNLGICYYKGDGVKKDLPLALTLMEPLADEGEAQAQYFVGLCYLKGYGVTMDAVRGKAYLQKAAAQGHQGAEQHLASLAVGNHPATLFAHSSSQSLQGLPNSPAEQQQQKQCVLQ